MEEDQTRKCLKDESSDVQNQSGKEKRGGKRPGKKTKVIHLMNFISLTRGIDKKEGDDDMKTQLKQKISKQVKAVQKKFEPTGQSRGQKSQKI